MHGDQKVLDSLTEWKTNKQEKMASPRPTDESNGLLVRLELFALLTICGFLIFALTMTFVPVLPTWVNYTARAGFLVMFAALWWSARGASHFKILGPNLYGHSKRILEFSSNFHPPGNLVASRLFRAMGAAFGWFWIWQADLRLRDDYIV